MKVVLNRSVLFWAAFVAVGAGVYFDTREYRAALTEFGGESSLQALTKQAGVIENDVNAYTACGKFYGNDYVIAEAGRDCILSALPKVRSFQGAFVFATKASSWLEAHPEDSALRDAAIAAINNGWADVAANRQQNLLAEKVSDAHDKSFILSLAHGKSSGDSTAKAVEMLRNAEIAVANPQLFRKQIERTTALYAASAAPSTAGNKTTAAL